MWVGEFENERENILGQKTKGMFRFFRLDQIESQKISDESREGS